MTVIDYCPEAGERERLRSLEYAHFPPSRPAQPRATVPAPPPPPPSPVAPPPPRRECTFDIECYRNYFLVKFRFCDTGEYLEFEAYPDNPTYAGEDGAERLLDVAALRRLMNTVRAYGFNSNGYDLPMLTLALTGVSCNTLKNASDAIIVGRMKPWAFYESYGLIEYEDPRTGWTKYGAPATFDTVDLMEVAPGVGVSLKMYAGRMHSRTMQDLPIEPSALILPEQRPLMRKYCGNDLDVTWDLLQAVRERLTLREKLTSTYGSDCRSKSDAQIAEVAIKARLGFKAKPDIWHHGKQFHYQAPAYVAFRTPELQEVLRIVTTVPFTVNKVASGEILLDENGEKVSNGVQLPAEIAGRDIRLGETLYRIGIGGLHSQEERRVSASTVLDVVQDSDVKSYYPSLIIMLGMFPRGLGPRFLEIYREIYDQRLAAKAEEQRLTKHLAATREQLSADAIARLEREILEQKTIADGFKIVLNGAFGKLGSEYSILYAPDLMIRVTITGQLCLLMLAEAFELAGIRVVSANTDGIVTVTPRHLAEQRAAIIRQWEATTGLEMETTEYKLLASRDVNSYVAVKTDGKAKGKGAYALSGLLNNKHPQKDVCIEAVHAYLAKGIPVEETVRGCRDIRKFIVVRAVKGGAEWGGTSPYQDKARTAEKRAFLQLLGWIRTSDKPEKWALSDTDVGEHGLDAAYKAACASVRVAGEYLGKAVRWYYSVDGRPIVYRLNGNKVASSDGARPLMTLPDEMPADVDYQSYIDEAKQMIVDLGVTM